MTANLGRRFGLVPREPHPIRVMRIAQVVGLTAAIGCNAAVAQTPRAAAGQAQQVSAVTEIACPRGSQILILLQSSTAPAYVAVDAMPAAGQGDAKRLDAATVPPEAMPNTLDLTQIIGDKEVFVTVREQAPNANSAKDSQSHLEGYIGCGEWQARVLGGQPNTFLLNRTPSAQPAPEANATPAPKSAPREANAAPPPLPTTPPVPPARSNDQLASRGGAQDQRAAQVGQAPRIASELKTLGLLGVWAQSCERSASFREIYVGRSGRSFFRVDFPDAPPNLFNREIVDFQRLSANRFQLTARGRFSSEEDAVVTSKYRMENNRLIPEDVRTASGHVSVQGGRIAAGRFQGEAVRGLVKCLGPRAG
jgi:hypothetical protein